MEEAERRRRERRAFVREHHPDRGGDPDAFVAGLAAFEDGTGAVRESISRVTVIRRRPLPVRLVARGLRLIGVRAQPSRVR